MTGEKIGVFGLRLFAISFLHFEKGVKQSMIM